MINNIGRIRMIKNPIPEPIVNEFTIYKCGRRWKHIYTDWEYAIKENKNENKNK